MIWMPEITSYSFDEFNQYSEKVEEIQDKVGSF